MLIRKPDEKDYPRLVEIWAGAVKATHHFLPEEYFRKIHAAMPSEYLPGVDLYAVYVPVGGAGGVVGSGITGANGERAAQGREGASTGGVIAGFMGLSYPCAAAEGLSDTREPGLTGAREPGLPTAGAAAPSAAGVEAPDGAALARVEMLFVDPACHRQGLGRALLDFAGKRHPVLELDVNEQNPGALAFYERYGFKLIARSEKDGSGEPYPLLTMRLEK